MSKKLYAAFVPLLATLAFAAMPATSQAAFHWFPCEFLGAGHAYTDSECLTKNGGAYEKVKIPNGEGNKIQVVAFGKLTFTATSLNITFTCKALVGGNIWNLEADGHDNIEAFFNYECTSTSCTTLTTKAQNLSWLTELGEVAGKPVDKIKGIEIVVTCNGTAATFTGELTPKLVGPTASSPLVAEFTSTTGELTGPGGAKAKVEGSLSIVGFRKAETIFVV